MDLHDARALGRTLLDEHGLHNWTVATDRAKSRAGICRYATRTIGLSGPVTLLVGEEEVRQTLLHEVAHALVGGAHGHDFVWQARARAIGYDGAREVVAPRGLTYAWTATCPGGHVGPRQHRAPLTLGSCALCLPTFDLAFLWQWSRHGERVPVEAMPQRYRERHAAMRRAEARRRERQGVLVGGLGS